MARHMDFHSISVRAAEWKKRDSIDPIESGSGDDGLAPAFVAVTMAPTAGWQGTVDWPGR